MFVFWWVCCSNASFTEDDFRSLTMQNGLADNTVPSIFKDKEGFMWFGTDNGLSRYDGRNFKNFNVDNQYLHVSYIGAMSDNYLGVIADNRLSFFSFRQEGFVPYDKFKGPASDLSDFLYAGNNSFWAISRDMLLLYKFDEIKNGNGYVSSIRITKTRSFKLSVNSDIVNSSFCFSENRKYLYILTNHLQLISFDIAKKRVIKSIYLSKGTAVSINGMLQSDHILWISTLGQGIICYNFDTGKTDYITHGQSKSQLSHNDVYGIIRINNHRYLAVTWGGFTIITLDKDHIGKYSTEIFSNLISSHHYLETRMLSAFYDVNGMLWIGTNGGGVLFSDLRTQYYTQYHQSIHNEICQIAIDNHQYFWLATFNKGILRSVLPYSRGHRLDFQSVGTAEVRSKNTVLCVLKDRSGRLWFGNSDGSLTMTDPRTNQFTVRYLHDERGILNKSAIWSLIIDHKNNFWLGTEKGLLRYNVKKNVFYKARLGNALNDNLFVRAMVETKDGSLWLGTNNNGLYRLSFRPDGKLLVLSGYEKKLMNMDYINVRSLLAASNGNLYVGYWRGFAILSPKKNAILEFYNTRNGMCSNFVGCIVEDGDARIWLGNASAISRYSRHQHIFYNYYISGSNRSALLYDGMLFFGSNKSLTYFNPRSVDFSHQNDKVHITGLEIDNHPVDIDEVLKGQRVLDYSLSYTDAIKLSNKNRDFSIVFNNLSYSESMQHYEYRLLPYQDKWLVSGESNKASFTNLPAGSYSFEVRNIYPDGSIGPITSMKVKILPHWSQTIFFRLCILAMALIILYYILRYFRKRQLRLEHEMQMKNELTKLNMEWEKERQIRVERENFFTSAAHELRTPLTLILSPLSDLINSSNVKDKTYKTLLTMYKNGSSLQTLVNHLLYVQKIEAGMIKLQLSDADIVKTTKDIADSFNALAEKQSIQFAVTLPNKPIELCIDVEKISSAIKNLLSNAFKYTPPDGMVRLSVSQTSIDEKDYCVITVADTGTGISLEAQEHIFDSFITGSNMPNFSTKIGIGLRIVKNTMDLHHGQVKLKSAPGEGCSFCLYIPFGSAHFANDKFEKVQYSFEKVSHYEIQTPTYVTQNDSNTVPLSKKRLLIIEDNDDMRKYVGSLFSEKFIIVEALNGKEGVKASLEEKPNLIISDVMMPVMDGFSCCKEIRSNPLTAHIPIIILTAKAEDADIILSSQCGADDYMMKPFNPEVLRAKVDNLVLQREQLKQIYTKALMLKSYSLPESDKDDFMQEVVNVIESKLSSDSFSVQVLAEQLNMSQPTLYRKMKLRTDMSVIDIIRSVRVAKAASLIMERRYSVQEISEMVGFNDVRTLRKHFMEQFGVSPSKYIGENIK